MRPDHAPASTSPETVNKREMEVSHLSIMPILVSHCVGFIRFETCERCELVAYHSSRASLCHILIRGGAEYLNFHACASYPVLACRHVHSIMPSWEKLLETIQARRRVAETKAKRQMKKEG